MRSVVEALTEASARTQDPEQLITLIRPKLGRMIVQNLLENRETLSVLTLDPQLEQLLHNVIQQSGGSHSVVLEPGLAEGLFTALRRSAKAVEEDGLPAVLVVSPSIRPWMSRAARFRIPDMAVLSYGEIPDDQQIKVIGTVQADQRSPGETATEVEG
jgi:flagellar biosynthesis protein FlhA